jgi:hypothetical protein
VFGYNELFSADESSQYAVVFATFWRLFQCCAGQSSLYDVCLINKAFRKLDQFASTDARVKKVIRSDAQLSNDGSWKKRADL